MLVIPKSQLPDLIRTQREKECFTIINRGVLWYNSLTTEQYAELKKWYKDWLDAPVTLNVPKAPMWLKDKINLEEEII